MNTEDSGSNNGHALIKQPHGGALLPGGVVGHKGGPGKPASVVRQTCRESFAARIPILERIADSEDTPERERIRAVQVLAEYGVGAAKGITKDDVERRLREQNAALWEYLRAQGMTDAQIDGARRAMMPAWGIGVETGATVAGEVSPPVQVVDQAK